MTKEEYERLLKSDYWKGYSYSIIKERNFTCEDCGRQFLNERNKLQVHHLVYRDVKPWSYKPEELIVLCEDCHRKRHGIASPVSQEKSSYRGNVGYSSGNYDRGGYRSGDSVLTIIQRWVQGKNHGRILSYAYIAVFASILLALIYVISYREPKIEGPSIVKEYPPSIPNDTKNTSVPSATSREGVKNVISDEGTAEVSEENQPLEPLLGIPQADESIAEPKDNAIQTTTQRAENDDKSTREPSTLELLERKNHADVVKQAKRAGVSTEGSTIDILERINHADVVKQAKRAGVSTEGSTIDILERINHADVVKQAKRAGVSTEGSTTDILERINRKDLESLGY